MKLNDVKIGWRLGAVIAAILVVAAALLGTSLFSEARNRSTIGSTERQASERIALANDMQLSLLRTALAIQNVGLQNEVSAINAAVVEANKERAALKDVRRRLQDQSLDSDEKSMLDEVDSLEVERRRYVETALGLAQQFNTEEAASVISKKIDPLNKKTLAILSAFIAKQKGAADAAMKRIDEQSQLALLAVSASAVVALVLALIASLYLTRSIVTPLQDAVNLTQKVAQGDLRGLIRARGQDETGQLLLSLQSMQSSLIDVVSRVRSGSQIVSSASSEIAHGNADLSSRTESQASALQETAASMEQLSSTVKQNADSARLANDLAKSASTVAVAGGDVVSEVVETMKGISGSSKKIADIINVIDAIAFQTNILALNAAVEAARAGEQGRGFAVVASEVRSLAGRSAEAAKEIKALINDSVSRVDQGTVLADKAGNTMGEVVRSIQRVSDVMGEIMSASVEQSQGVAQVGEAVSQMDQATQQNAALVEQMAAAASSLNTQAQYLVEAVSVFKLDASFQSSAREPVAVGTTVPAAPLAPRATPSGTMPRQKLPARAEPISPRSPSPPVKVADTKGEDSWETF